MTPVSWDGVARMWPSPGPWTWWPAPVDAVTPTCAISGTPFPNGAPSTGPSGRPTVPCSVATRPPPTRHRFSMSGSSSRYTTYEWLWRNGRLGNQLWQIASPAGIAAANGTEPRFPIWEYQPYFRVPAEFFVQKLPTPRQDLGTDYLQELRHFAGIAERVRDWFQPSEKAEAVVRERLDELDLRGHLTAVHVRRGDYLYHPDHFPALGDRYYARAMAEVRRDHPGTTFVVFSDDPAWCRAKFRDGCRDNDGVSRPVEMVVRMGEPEDHWDLFLMSMSFFFNDTATTEIYTLSLHDAVLHLLT